MNRFQSNVPAPVVNGGGSPFDEIRHLDAYGREYWSARELMPFLGYSRWENFTEAIDQARGVIAVEHGEAAAQTQIAASTKITKNARGQNRSVPDFELSRYAAYLTAMRGDSRKPEIRAALVYFAVKTREAELGALTEIEIRRTALARAREMVDYRIFRDMMRDNAPDYAPSSRTTQIFFGAMQNKLYRHITGMTAKEIVRARPISTWKGCEDGKQPTKKDREIAKNYLSCSELEKLDRMVARLCLRAEDIADDKVHLRLDQWSDLVDIEISTARPLVLPTA